MNLFSQLALYFSFPFVRYAFVTGIVVSLSASLLGVTLVLKRYSFMGDGLSHVAFGAMAIAAVLSVSNDLIVILPITALSAILLLRMSKNAKIKGDAALAILSVGAMAIGYMLLSMFSTSSNISGDVCSSLFGSTSILTLTNMDMWISVILSGVIILLFILFYNKILALTFDENFARATGVQVNAYNMIIAVVTALVIVMAMQLCGAILTSALIIFPALSAMRIFDTFKKVTVCSGVIAVVTSALGMLISILISSPVGATIVVCDLLIFLGCIIFGKK